MENKTKEDILQIENKWFKLTIQDKLKHLSLINEKRLASRSVKKTRHDANKEQTKKKALKKKSITPKIFLTGKNLELFNTLPESIRNMIK